MERFDVAVIGAGAAGMMCAAQAGQAGLRVVLIDHAVKIGEKIRISGGGRCNFTNVNTAAEHFISRNRHFCRSALARYSAAEFVALVRKHRIGFHEKHRGQLFCDESAEQIVAMLEAECAAGGVTWRTGCEVKQVRRAGLLPSGNQSGGLGPSGADWDAEGEVAGGPEAAATIRGAAPGYVLDTGRSGSIMADRLVIATGGLSIPKIGASDFGYRIARQFGLKIVEPRPALVPLTFASDVWRPFNDLAGIASEVEIATDGPYGPGRFTEDLLFTHKGLSGPAVLQISTFWQSGNGLRINLLPGVEVAARLTAAKRQGGTAKGNLLTLLAQWLPRRLAQAVCEANPGASGTLLADCPDRVLEGVGAQINRFEVMPAGTEGFRKAEVTVGGVDTRELSSQTMEATKAPGLHFIGEVVDVTGWLGGYNFQWAWSSAVACARGMVTQAKA